MRASPPPNSLSRLRRSSSSRSCSRLIARALQHEVPLCRDALHLLRELVVGRLPTADRLHQPSSGLLLDGVVSLEILFESARDDLNADLGVAELHEPAVLE